MLIETPRLLLRTPRRQDAPAMLRIHNSPFVMLYSPMKPWDLPRMEKQIEQEAAQPGRAFYIEEKAGNTLIGGLWLEEDELRYGPAALTLSYCLDEPAARKGYMTEALTAVIRYAFTDLKLDVLSARVFHENAASLRLLKKLGFTHEGTLRRAVTSGGGVTYDDMLFSLLREESSL